MLLIYFIGLWIFSEKSNKTNSIKNTFLLVRYVFIEQKILFEYVYEYARNRHLCERSTHQRSRKSITTVRGRRKEKLRMKSGENEQEKRKEGRKKERKTDRQTVRMDVDETAKLFRKMSLSPHLLFRLGRCSL